eukprot:1905880-Amphidinium_carterae.1
MMLYHKYSLLDASSSLTSKLKLSTCGPRATFITCAAEPLGGSVATVALPKNCLYSFGASLKRIAVNACKAVAISTAPPSACAPEGGATVTAAAIFVIQALRAALGSKSDVEPLTL